MVIDGQFPLCDKLRAIKPSDDWWFFQCARAQGNITEVYSKEEREALSVLQEIFDNKWYLAMRERRKGFCASQLLGGSQNTEGNMMRLASNILRLGGISRLGRKVRDDLRSVTKHLDTALELEIMGCFVESGFAVTPYPNLSNGSVPDGMVAVDVTDIYFEVTHNEWPLPDNFPGPDWKSKQGNKIAEKCIAEVSQLPKNECGVIIINPPTLIDGEMGTAILAAMGGYLQPDVYTRISGVILVNKLIERSGFLRAVPIVIVNVHATKRCDRELNRLASALTIRT